MLANLLDNPELVRTIGRAMRDTDRGSATIVIVLLAIVTMALSAHFVWQWRRRVDSVVTGGQLLNDLGGRLGLTGPQKTLLRRLARAAGVEPAAALLSEAMLLHVVQAGEAGGVHLDSQQTVEVGRILDAVCAAARTSMAA